MSDVTLLKALVLLVPVGTLFSWSVILFFRAKTVWHFLQLLGAGCLMIVVLTHLFEALNLFPWMGWGSSQSVGHYLDLWSAFLGLMLFAVGSVCNAISKLRV
jgi:zinc transporter ZupT